MKLLTQDFEIPTRSESVKISFVGDVHDGAEDCDTELFEASIDRIARQKNHYLFGMGDYGEYINFTDKRFDPRDYPNTAISELSNFANYQADRLVKKFSPVKSRILGMLRGNHDETVCTKYHYDVHAYLCRQLSSDGQSIGLDLGYSAILRLKFIRAGAAVRTIKICAHHGHGGGRRPGAKINKVEDLVNSYPNCSIYAMGHCHDLFLRPYVAVDIAERRDDFVEYPRMMLMSGHYKKIVTAANSTWGEKKQFSPTARGCVTLEIFPFVKTKDGQPIIHGLVSTQGLPV